MTAPTTGPMVTVKLSEAIELLKTSVSFLESSGGELVGQASYYWYQAVYWEQATISAETFTTGLIDERKRHLKQAEALLDCLTPVATDISAEAAADINRACGHLLRHEDKLLRSMRLRAAASCVIDGSIDLHAPENFCVFVYHRGYWPDKAWRRVVESTTGTESRPSKFVR